MSHTSQLIPQSGGTPSKKSSGEQEIRPAMALLTAKQENEIHYASSVIPRYWLRDFRSARRNLFGAITTATRLAQFYCHLHRHRRDGKVDRWERGDAVYTDEDRDGNIDRMIENRHE